MKFVEPSVSEILETDPIKKIELIGRTCYKSENAITEDSAAKFVANLIKNKHHAMLEHAVFTFVADKFDIVQDINCSIFSTKFMEISLYSGIGKAVISCNLRAIMEGCGGLIDTLRTALCIKYPTLFGMILPEINFSERSGAKVVTREDLVESMLDDDIDKHTYRTFKFVTDRGVTHELVRHRVASFAQSSTRYCNYSKDKFGNEITYVKSDSWKNLSEDSLVSLYDTLKSAENSYMQLISNGCTPQIARAVLPNQLMTEIVVTASEAEWHHIADLRLRGITGAPHPDMKYLMTKLKEIYPAI